MKSKKKDDIESSETDVDATKLDTDQNNESDTDPTQLTKEEAKKFYEENCLLQQTYVKDPDKTIDMLLKEMIGKLGENIGIRRFARFVLGA